MAFAWDHWTGFKARLMSIDGVQLTSGGTPLLWQPSTAVHPIIFEVTWDEVIEDRETVGGGLYPSLRGWRGRVDMTLETLAGNFAATGLALPLELVLGSQVSNVGSYLQMYLTALSADSWTRVVMSGGWHPETLGKNAGMRVSLTFLSTSLRTTAFPYRDAAESGSFYE